MLEWVEPSVAVVDGVAFTTVASDDLAWDRLFIHKPRSMLEPAVEALARWSPTRVVELGIGEGGSVALLSRLSGAERWIAIDIRTDRVTELDEHVERLGLGDRVRLHYGVDQSDGSALTSILADDLEGAAPDLVIDDASHEYGPTLATFECLFPRLAPGGTYVIEDWNYEHRLAHGTTAVPDADGDDWPVDEVWRDAFASFLEQMVEGVHNGERPPLLRLALELVLASASGGDVIGTVRFEPWWIEIERGPGEPAEPFRLDAEAVDHFSLLAQMARSRPSQ